MERIYNYIENNEVYPIKIIYKAKTYLTLYYYTKDTDRILHGKSKSILSFLSTEDIENFCKKNGLKAVDEIVEYNFDETIANPVNYKKIFNNWNLLNTIASTFGMFFEGDLQKYTAIYDFLFRLNTSIEPISSTYFISKKHYECILKVFRKKSRLLNNFEFYVD